MVYDAFLLRTIQYPSEVISRVIFESLMTLILYKIRYYRHYGAQEAKTKRKKQLVGPY
jgi:hypothetical protein